MCYQQYRRQITGIIFVGVVIMVYLVYLNSYHETGANSTEIQINQNHTDELIDIQSILLSIDFENDDYYIFDDQMCNDNGENTTVMILVTTAPSNMIKRDYIRKTWGHYGTRSDIGFAFIIGRVINETLEKKLQHENSLFNDIIRVDFVDSYNNLTLKSISSLKWFDRFCNQASFYLKSDDDVFINIPRLLEFIEAQHRVNRTIFGHLAENWIPFRNPRSKYYVSKTDYPENVFEPFTTGPVYLMTSDCVHDLFNESLNITHPLKLEDVFITGIVASKLNISRIDVKEITNNNKVLLDINVTVHKIITKHELRPNILFDMWKFLET